VALAELTVRPRMESGVTVTSRRTMGCPASQTWSVMAGGGEGCRSRGRGPRPRGAAQQRHAEEGGTGDPARWVLGDHGGQGAHRGSAKGEAPRWEPSVL
jgi:hypothetical protein